MSGSTIVMPGTAIRAPDGAGNEKIHPDKLVAHMPAAIFDINDTGTGLVLTTPTNFTDVKGAPMTKLVEPTIFPMSVANGTITCNHAFLGMFFIQAALFVAVNSQVLELQIVKNGTLISPLYQKITQAATGIIVSGVDSTGFGPVAKGDVFKLQAKGSTGNVTLNQLQWGVIKIADLDPAAADLG